MRQAAETYNLAFNRLTEKAVNVRSEARDAYRIYRSTYDIASHYQREVLPLRKIITEEMQLRYLQHAGRRVRAAHRSAAAPRLAARARSTPSAELLPRAVRAAGRRQWRRRDAYGGERSQPISARQRRPTAATDTETQRCFHAEDFSAPRRWSAPVAVSGRVQAAAIPEAPPWTRRRCSRRCIPSSGPDYRPVVTLERLVAALAHERRLEGISSRRRARGARVRRRHEGESVGL